MAPIPHVVASGIISALFLAYFRSVGYAAICFLSGVLIDGDHIIDYYLNRGLTLNILKIYKCCLTNSLKKIYVILHSYELVLFLWAAIYIFGLSKFWQAIAVGMTQHILLDQIANPVTAFAYFFVYRAANGFDAGRILAIGKGRGFGAKR
ncbi:MAG: hypothetical protein PHX20_04960 [Candidatus Omnitrophica bacterium]|nr:hypothetical protein [Candidatus Omnitrophota bacterium]MDD5436873.1 hypothetical protein [Candidatus Omnitrophota bacterium]